MENQDLEESIHEQNSVWLNAAGVQEDRLWWAAEVVAVQNGLNHHQRLGQVLSHQHVSKSTIFSNNLLWFSWPIIPVERGLIWAVVEDLQKLWSPQMVHKLRVQTEVVRQAEAVWVVFGVLSKLLTLWTNKNANSMHYHKKNVHLPSEWASYQPSVACQGSHQSLP